MPRLSDKEIAGAVKAAGFPRASWNTAIAVALAESGGNSDALNDANSNGSSDYGLFQINSVHDELLNGGNWRDPVYNARMALEISSRGSNWLPWVAFNTGKYRAYLPRAVRASGSPVMPAAGAAAGSTLGVAGLPPVNSGGSLTDPNVWLRIGYFLLGALLILVALILATGTAGTLKQAARIVATRKVPTK
jgi:hypothetical protein